jgi:hypothetical protein
MERKVTLGNSTVQRFLAGKVRTVESYVDIFERFVEGFPCPDPIGSLGKAMAEFYDWKDADRYAGSYILTTSYKISGEPPQQRSSLEIIADDGFCRVIERSENQIFLSCEGVLVYDGQTAIVMLKDKQTSTPKQFLLSADGETMSGQGTMVEFEPDAAADFRQPTLLSISVSMNVRPAEQVLAPRRSYSLAQGRILSLPEPSFEEMWLSRPLPVMGDLPEGKSKPGQDHQDEKANPVSSLHSEFLSAARRDDLATVKRLLQSGAEIDTPDFRTGLTALHLAVGRNALDVVIFLVCQDALFVPDRLGRMPTTIAAECQVSEVMCDFIVDAEAEARARAEGV